MGLLDHPCTWWFARKIQISTPYSHAHSSDLLEQHITDTQPDQERKIHSAKSGEIHVQASYALFLLERVAHSTLSLCKKKYICIYVMCLPREGYLWLISGFSLGQTTDTPMPNKILNSKREKGWVLTVRNIVQFKQSGPAVQLHHLVNILKAMFLDARQR